MIEKPAEPASTGSTNPLRRAPPGLRSLAPAQSAVERQAAAGRQGPADAAGKKRNDFTNHDDRRRRARELDATASPPCHGRAATLLRHERLRKLPRCR